MEPLKEMFNKTFYKELSSQLINVYPTFKSKEFITSVTANLSEYSLNQRLRNTSLVLHKYLPKDYSTALKILYSVIPTMKNGYTNLLFPDFVGLFGQNEFKKSMEALHFFTSFGSAEFAIRTFIVKDPNKTIEVMKKWANDSNLHVRRLASEGSRPRLPWSFKLDEVIKHPSLTTPILEQLKDDNEIYVKKSVANHLNDISKDNKLYALELLKKWDKKNPNTLWITKHACRNLIKQGDTDALLLFNITKSPKITIQNFKIKNSVVKLGDQLTFSFELISKTDVTQQIIVDYVIHYQKKLNKLTKKVFKLSSFELLGKQEKKILKTQLIKDFSTRKHYEGIHQLEIQINGVVFAKKEFTLQY